MVTSCSMFSQMLKLIPRTDFERMVKETDAECRTKGLSSWSQFVAMLFCHAGRARSLREIEGGLKSCEGKWAHLGIEAPARASLSYANARRTWELFEKVSYRLFEVVAAKAVGKKKFRYCCALNNDRRPPGGKFVAQQRLCSRLRLLQERRHAALTP